MGTRNLTLVKDKEGKTKVAQYRNRNHAGEIYASPEKFVKRRAHIYEISECKRNYHHHRHGNDIE